MSGKILSTGISKSLASSSFNFHFMNLGTWGSLGSIIFVCSQNQYCSMRIGTIDLLIVIITLAIE